MTWTPGEAVQLETPRYRLRTLTEADATDRYLSWLHDAEVMRYVFSRVQDHTRDSVREYIRQHDGLTAFLLGIFDHADGIHVGNFSARGDPISGVAQLGVLIGDRRHWGRGVVLEARAALLDFLFGPAGLQRVEGVVYGNHAASLFNYQAQGWRMDGRLPEPAMCDGREVEILQFSMSRENWLARRRADA